MISLSRMEELAKKNPAKVIDLLNDRDEEKEHEEWLEAQIRSLGGDAHAPSERATLVQTESEGIERVAQRDPSLPHDFHALLAAELSDNAGWDLLVTLADEAGRPRQKEFKQRLHEEEEHLLLVRETVAKLTGKEISEPAPAAP